ncbi:uncharacterized protein LOC143535492 [Bidens hawaiensis]|uniref:uncharacterized protein LOC143535492 n=1 Tax=Bidens hawaiensis TaxID=980011 RepID=UPI00404AD806
MKDDESIDTFMEGINTYATKVSELGKSLDKPMLVRKLLEFVQDQFIQIVASIEQSTDIYEVSIDKIVGKLKTYEEWVKLNRRILGDGQDRLLYTCHDNNLGREKRFEDR